MGNSRFSDGFLLGAMAGGALVFLLGTKKGNQVLKLIMEEGRASLEDIMEGIEEYKQEAELSQLNDEIEGDGIDEVVEKVEKTEKTEKTENVKEANGKPKSSKRFFNKPKK